MTHQWRAGLIGLCCAFGLACHPAVPVRPAPAGESRPAGACSVALGEPVRLRMEDGKNLYVEPVALEASGASVLVAGSPNYVWEDPPDAPARLLGKDSIFGATLDRAGVIRVVPAPLGPKWLGPVRALGRGDGTWDVVFAELEPYPPATYPPPTDTIARIWHGVYDGRAWASLQEIPIPEGVRLYTSGASGLVRRGDTLTWALTEVAEPFYQDVAVFERRGGRWHTEIIPTRRISYIALSHTKAAGLLMAVVSVDTTVRRDNNRRGDNNSLFLWTRQPGWTMTRRVVLGGQDGPAHHPVFTSWRGRPVLTWYADTPAGQEARMLVDPLNTPLEEIAVVDPDYGGMGPVQSAAVDGSQFWVVPYAVDETLIAHLRFLRAAGGGVDLVADLPSTYFGNVRAATWGEEMVIAGTYMTENDGPVTLLSRTRIACPAR